MSYDLRIETSVKVTIVKKGGPSSTVPHSAARSVDAEAAKTNEFAKTKTLNVTKVATLSSNANAISIDAIKSDLEKAAGCLLATSQVKLTKEDTKQSQLKSLVEALITLSGKPIPIDEDETSSWRDLIANSYYVQCLTHCKKENGYLIKLWKFNDEVQAGYFLRPSLNYDSIDVLRYEMPLFGIERPETVLAILHFHTDSIYQTLASIFRGNHPKFRLI